MFEHVLTGFNMFEQVLTDFNRVLTGFNMFEDVLTGFHWF